eukprot:COSAG05_NODE_885_length_6763_cov_10.115396_2_plen_72_part_00
MVYTFDARIFTRLLINVHANNNNNNAPHSWLPSLFNHDRPVLLLLLRNELNPEDMHSINHDVLSLEIERQR